MNKKKPSGPPPVRAAAPASDPDPIEVELRQVRDEMRELTDKMLKLWDDLRLELARLRS